MRFGAWGERIALIYYIMQGYWPMPRPRHERVQTDIIVKRGDTLVLVEVKTRRNMEAYEKVISHTQKTRLAQQAKVWAARYPALAVRLDVVHVALEWPFVRCWRDVLRP